MRTAGKELKSHEVCRGLSLRQGPSTESWLWWSGSWGWLENYTEENCDFMKTIILICAASAGLSVAAHAQIGWTLEQCRGRIGPEFHAANGETHYFHVSPWGRGLGENICISFDPDGTVGTIQWIKLDGDAFSEAEIQQRFRVASHVTSQRRNDHYTGELNWIGGQNGKVIFDASEADNGQGAYVLTISTR
jgi:hypothetical protein